MVFFYFVNFLFLSSTIFPEVLLLWYLPKFNSFAAIRFRNKLLLSQTSFNRYHLLCTASLGQSFPDWRLDCSRWSEDVTLPWTNLGPSRWSDWEEMRPNWLGNRWKRKQPHWRPGGCKGRKETRGARIKRRQRQSGIEMKKLNKNRGQTKNQSVLTLTVSPGSKIDVRLKLDG